MIKVKLGELEVIINNLSQVMNSEGIPFNTGYWLAKIAKKLLEEIEIYNEARIKICKEYSNKDENGNPKIIYEKDDKGNDILDKSRFDINNIDKFNEQLNLLKDTEIELNFNQIKKSDFGKAMPKPIFLVPLTEFIIEDSIIETVKPNLKIV